MDFPVTPMEMKMLTMVIKTRTNSHNPRRISKPLVEGVEEVEEEEEEEAIITTTTLLHTSWA